MKKILLIDSSYPINVRNIKIMETLSVSNKFELHVVSWNRDHRKIQHSSIYKESIFDKIAPYGNKLNKLSSFFKYFKYCKKNIKSIQPDYIISSHWDILFLISFLKPLNTKLVYENLDMPASTNSIIYRIIRSIEAFALRNTDVIILASRFFEPEYTFFKKDIYTIENRPSKKILENVKSNLKHNTDNLKLSFIGGIRYIEIMKNLVLSVENLPVDLLLFGDGPDLEELKKFSSTKSNVFFFGRYNYSEIKHIYDISDIIWAVYPNKDFNVKYAISNKFFESLVFKKPCIFSNNTKLGDYVFENNIGLTVDPYNVSHIRNMIINILENESICSKLQISIEEYLKNNSSFWEEYEEKFEQIFS